MWDMAGGIIAHLHMGSLALKTVCSRAVKCLYVPYKLVINLVSVFLPYFNQKKEKKYLWYYVSVNYLYSNPSLLFLLSWHGNKSYSMSHYTEWTGMKELVPLSDYTSTNWDELSRPSPNWMAVITIDGDNENVRGLNSILNNKKQKQHMAMEKVSKKWSCSLIWKIA